jgi:pilus assembly protein CpaC
MMRTHTKFSFILTFMALAVGLGSAQAQTPLAPPQPNIVTIEAGRSAGQIVVPAGKSQLLNVDQQFTDISIGNAEIASVVPLSRNLIYLLGLQLGTTNLTISSAGGDVIAVVDVVVTYDVAGLQRTILDVAPEETIDVSPAGDSLLLQGNVSSVDNLRKVVAVAERYAPGAVTNLLSVGGSQQVLLEVRFAEVQRNTLQALGANFDYLLDDGTNLVEIITGVGIAPDAFGAAGGLLTDGDWSLAAAVDVLERNGVLRTLAEPNLVALSGDTASFLAGGEIPIPVATASVATAGVPTITVQYKAFGVGLSFTPTVISTELVNIEFSTEVSAIDDTVSIIANGISVPGFKVRRTHTTVEMKDGQTFAIAGLLQDEFEDGVRMIPGLGNIPILGTLFRSSDFQQRQTELVVIVTVRLVEPGSAQRLASPADALILPTEMELLGEGNTEGLAPAAPSDNSTGFVLP